MLGSVVERARRAAAALRRPGARRRWSVVIAGFALLASLPALFGLIPAKDGTVPSPQAVLAQALASAGVQHTGYAESLGTLPLPDAGPLADVQTLLGERSRLRVYWAGPASYRVDKLTLTGEQDTYVTGRTTQQWDSGRRAATVIDGQVGIRLPQPVDVLPGELGRRLLAGAPPEQVQGIGTKRIATRRALGLRVRTGDPRSLVGTVEVWVDAQLGLPLRVTVTPTGETQEAFSTSYIDLKLEPPAATALRFALPPDATVETLGRVDAQEGADRLSPFALPPTVAGLARRSDVRGSAGTYGEAYTVVAVLQISGRQADDLRRRLPDITPVRTGPYGEASVIESPLLSGLVVQNRGRGYVLAGTVTTELLEQVATDLARNPPRTLRPGGGG